MVQVYVGGTETLAGNYQHIRSAAKLVNMRLIKKSLFLSVYLVLSVFAILLFGELLMMGAGKITGSSDFGTYKTVIAPVEPGVVRVAIFGGSSAAGKQTEISFEDILRWELGKDYPGLRFLIKNFARSGLPFHRVEAETVKNVIAGYDIIIIYAGHNEAQNYLDDVGYFRKAEYKQNKYLPGEESRSTKFLKTRSRVFSVSRKIHYKYVRPLFFDIPEGTQTYEFQTPNEFEATGALPAEEILKIKTNYEQDLEEIANLAKESGKYVIISSVPSNGDYKPNFSVHRYDLTEDEFKAFHAAYEQGLKMYESLEFDEAIVRFLDALKIDGNVAIANYLIGHSYFETGDVIQGRRFIRRSIDYDGIPQRALGAVNDVAKAVGNRYDRVYFVDTVQSFDQALDQGLTNKDLFTDFQHPSSVGHAIIARNFLLALSDIEPLKTLESEGSVPDFIYDDPISLANYYQSVLRVADSKYQTVLLNSALWHIAESKITAYSEDLLEIAENKIRTYHNLTDKSSDDRGLLLLVLAIIDGNRANTASAVTLANQALQLAPDLIVDILNRRVDADGIKFNGKLLIRELNNLGLEYSDSQNKFVLGVPAN